MGGIIAGVETLMESTAGHNPRRARPRDGQPFLNSAFGPRFGLCFGFGLGYQLINTLIEDSGVRGHLFLAHSIASFSISESGA